MGLLSALKWVVGLVVRIIDAWKARKDQDLCASVLQDMEARGYNAISLDPGTDEYRWAERMVDQGRLRRLHVGTYLVGLHHVEG